MGSVNLDVETVRAAYPALRDGYAYLDGAAGTQVPETVIDTVGGRGPGGNRQLGRGLPGQPPGQRHHDRLPPGRR